MNNIKKLNAFIFLSTFARSLVDCFIPIILYKKGLDIKDIFLFLLLNNFAINKDLIYNIIGYNTDHSYKSSIT